MIVLLILRTVSRCPVKKKKKTEGSCIHNLELRLIPGSWDWTQGIAILVRIGKVIEINRAYIGSFSPMRKVSIRMKEDMYGSPRVNQTLFGVSWRFTMGGRGS